MLAMPFTLDAAPARFRGAAIPELGIVAQGRLPDKDCHFGIMPPLKPTTQLPGTLPLRLAMYGPRGLDLHNRGGIVAEFLWERRTDDPSTEPDEVKAFLVSIDDLFATVEVQNQNFAAGSKMNGVDVSGNQKYAAFPGFKSWHNLTASEAAGSETQFGTRWSKVALETTRIAGGVIHFHLDGMGEIDDIISKQGDYSQNVTSRELRYLYRNWSRFKNCCLFYNGFDVNSRAVYVRCPWLGA